MKTIVRNVENKDNKEAIREAAGLLREGKLVAFPTETVYGLGWKRPHPESTRQKGDPLTILSSFISGAWR